MYQTGFGTEDNGFRFSNNDIKWSWVRSNTRPPCAAAVMIRPRAGDITCRSVESRMTATPKIDVEI
jgi:hypothetical protein